MASVIKRKIAGKSNVEISDSVRDYGNEPLFVKKAKESKMFLKKNGFPKDLFRKH
jgi:hypothetical protein